MRKLTRDLAAVCGLESLVLPAVIAGGLVISIIGACFTIGRQSRCAEIGVRSGYEESYVVPGRHGPDQCVCRGQRDEGGNVDWTLSETVLLD